MPRTMQFSCGGPFEQLQGYLQAQSLTATFLCGVIIVGTQIVYENEMAY